MNRNPSMAGLASLVQSRGRNGDSVLVHMAPEEVAGLQSLALAAGGSLTLNPDTGLYEANFLKKLLPTILGFGLNFLFPGLGALGSGLLVGAGETIRTGGDLGKGLMAGLGAFGGAGLGSALAGAGAVAGGAGQSAITAAGEAAATEAAKGTFASEALKTAAIEEAKKKAIEEATKKAIAEQAANKAVTQGAAGWTNLKAGASNLFSTKPGIGALSGMDAFGGTFNALPGGMIGKAGLVTTAANALTPEMEMPGGAYNIDDSYYEGADYDPATGTFKQGQWRKGYPGFPGYADGGAVMPRPNYNYPQAGITKSNYAPSLEYMKPREILDGYDTKIDPFTGAEGFADGGPVGVSPGAVGGDPRIVLEPGPVISPTLQPQQPQALPPQQSLEQYYQSLLSAPQQQNYNPAFFDYMQSLNKYVTSPVAPPPKPPAPPPPPPGDNRTTPPGGRPGGGGNWRFDPDLGQLVNDRGDLFNPRDFNFGNFRNLASAAFRNVGGDLGPSDGRMVYDPVTGGFRQPGSQTVDTPPGQDMSSDYSGLENMPMITDMAGYGQGSDLEGGYNAFNVDMGDYGQAMAQGNLTDIGQFAEPSYDFAGGTQNFDMGDMPVQPQMGDMSGYGQQFQGFQSLPTDFGSTYQPPAMMAPSLDMTAYSQQPMDFGSMGNYGLGALGGGYQAPQFQMPSYDSSTPAFEAPTASYSAPMTTGYDSTGVSAPQYGFGNSDVMYGQSMLGGDEPNVFGFAGGGAIQKAAAGKLVTGDGDGMSDDIRANINGDQEARLADGEFVIPADVVSHLGNGSTDAGADRLYAMMDRIRKARTGRKQQAPEIDAEKYLPA